MNELQKPNIKSLLKWGYSKSKEKKDKYYYVFYFKLTDGTIQHLSLWENELIREIDLSPFTNNYIQVRKKNIPGCRDLFPNFSSFRLKVMPASYGNVDHGVVCLTQDGQDEMVQYWNLLPGDRIQIL